MNHRADQSRKREHWSGNGTVIGVLVLLAIGMAMASRTFGQESAPAGVIFVSPEGDDQAEGTQQAPFRTLQRAQQAVRELKKTWKEKRDIVVVLRGGVYRLQRPLVFGPEDSGGQDWYVVYRAAEGEQVVLSGGKLVNGWKQTEDGLWLAEAALEPFRQLYVGGRRAVRARSGQLPENPAPYRWEFLHDPSKEGGLPDADFLHYEGFRTSWTDMARWKNQHDVELSFINVWSHMRYKVRAIRQEGEAALVLMLQPYFLHGRAKEGMQINMPAWVENARELLDQPGEWYYDQAAKRLYYMPRPGEDLEQLEVVAPQLERLLIVQGSPGRPVRRLRFEGLTFAEGNWALPNRIGHADVQANFTFDSHWPQIEVRLGGLIHVHNEYRKSPAAVLVQMAEQIVFHRCTFTRLGHAGIDIEQGSRQNQILGCHFYDISGSAIQVGDVGPEDHHPSDSARIVRDNTIANCLIHDCCLEYMGGVGIFVGYTTRTVIRNNEICRLPYTGVSVGWGWGEEDAGGGAYWQPFFYDTPTPSRENLICRNHIHHVMQPMQDGGGIYTLGRQPGTQILENYLHDNPGAPGGIYLDEGSADITVQHNLVAGVPKGLNFNNHAQDRRLTCKVENNYVYEEEKPAQWKPEEQKIIQSAGLEPKYRELLQIMQRWLADSE